MASWAPRSRQACRASGRDAVTATVAPSIRATWMAIVPIPELPPWISTVCRADSPAVITRFDHTVQVTSGRPAALTRSTPSGHRQHLHGGHDHPLRVPAAGQQRADLVADLPADDAGADRGDHARSTPCPRIGDAPGGTGYWPAACNRSARLTALAATSISTSPGPATGSGNLRPAQCRR